jgi:hypothetical protein
MDLLFYMGIKISILWQMSKGECHPLSLFHFPTSIIPISQIDQSRKEKEKK